MIAEARPSLIALSSRSPPGDCVERRYGSIREDFMTTTTHSRPGRRDFLKATTGAVALGLTVGAPHVARAQQKVICRIGHSEAIGSPLTDAFEKWAKLLNEKSGGRIEAQH